MERKYRVDYTKFTNCLRIAIVPDGLQDERIENVRKYAVSTRIPTIKEMQAFWRLLMRR